VVTKDSSIDAYLATLPADQRTVLERLRSRVAHLVPNAAETISYGMPAFTLNGHFLVSFAGWKSHCSIYPLTESFMAAHGDAVKGYGRTKGSLHFTPEKPLPDAVVDALVNARLADLEGTDSP
jgi:uncharacterized protein YdhG (YjbR/CyaY superfamily)